MHPLAVPIYNIPDKLLDSEANELKKLVAPKTNNFACTYITIKDGSYFISKDLSTN